MTSSYSSLYWDCRGKLTEAGFVVVDGFVLLFQLFFIIVNYSILVSENTLFCYSGIQSSLVSSQISMSCKITRDT